VKKKKEEKGYLMRECNFSKGTIRAAESEGGGGGGKGENFGVHEITTGGDDDGEDQKNERPKPRGKLARGKKGFQGVCPGDPTPECETRGGKAAGGRGGVCKKRTPARGADPQRKEFSERGISMEKGVSRNRKVRRGVQKAGGKT